MTALVTIIVAASALFGASVGDGGAQLVGTAAVVATEGVEQAPPGNGSARSSSGRSPLVIAGPRRSVDPEADGEPSSTTAPITLPGSTPAGAVDSAVVVGSASETGSSVALSEPLTAEATVPLATTSTSSAASSAEALPSTSPRAATGMVWQENFNSLDARRWQVEHSTYGDGNGERQCYRPENVRVEGGRLILTASSETVTCPNGKTRSVTSGMVRSRGVTFSPGQAIEFRVKLTPPDPANQAGLWPAVWASSWAGSWPRGGELDFLEVMTAEDPRRAVFSLHYADPSGDHELQNKAVAMSNRFSDGWHTIRFDYGHNGNLSWHLDGNEVFSVSAADTLQGYPAPFDQTIEEIKINLAVGGTPGPLASGALGASGATFEIDYIKVFDL